MDTTDVLIVEDNLELLDAVSVLITMNGYTVQTASSAQEALTILENHVPNLIICDISMPGMSGLELLEKVKIKGMCSAVVMLTASKENEKIIQAVQLGCLDYVIKPFDSDVFLSKLNSWIEVGRLLRERGDISRQLRLIDLFRLKNVKKS